MRFDSESCQTNFNQYLISRFFFYVFTKETKDSRCIFMALLSVVTADEQFFHF